MSSLRCCGWGLFCNAESERCVMSWLVVLCTTGCLYRGVFC